MRRWTLGLQLTLSLILCLPACEQSSSARRNGKVKVDDEEPSTTKKTTKPKTTEKDETSSSTDTFCSDSLSLTSLPFDPEEKNLKLDGQSTTLCALFKDSGKKVLMFQVADGTCSDCEENVQRTKNYFGLSSLQDHIEHIILFHSNEPESSTLEKLTANSSILTAYDFKNVLVKDTTQDSAQNGTMFILISRDGELEVHNETKYLDAISKAESLAKKVSDKITETIPDALQASKAKWNGVSSLSNKQLSLVIAE